jgi:hypothetical protein
MFTKQNKAQVWSCGGGTQSCAIAALIIRGQLPKPDFAVFANTGREVGYTLQYLDEVLKPQLLKAGVRLHEVNSSAFRSVDLWSGEENDSLTIPAFSTVNDATAKLPNFCTGEWKTRVIDRWLRTKGVGAGCYVKWIGFSIDETPRVLRVQKSQQDTRFPLVELHMSRRNCIQLVEEGMGWPPPPRSRCWCCPNQGDSEWRTLSPEEFQKAVQIERDIQKVDPHAWLHRSCVPLDQVDFSQPEDLFSRPCDSGVCFI